MLLVTTAKSKLMTQAPIGKDEDGCGDGHADTPSHAL